MTTEIASSPTIGQLNAEQKKERYAQLAAKLGRSKLEVIGLPGLHYFWADMNDNEAMLTLEGVGYSIVRELDAKAVLEGKAKPKIRAGYLKADGTYNNGDVILTCCSEETYEFIMLHNSERNQQMIDGAQRDFRTEADRLAVPVFDKQK